MIRMCGSFFYHVTEKNIKISVFKLEMVWNSYLRADDNELVLFGSTNVENKV